MSVFSNKASSARASADAYVAAVLGLVGERDPIEILGAMPDRVAELTEDLSSADLHRPEAPGKWSIVAVIAHLADSELVWACRVRMVLSHDRPRIVGYDQDLWAERLRYADAVLDDVLRRFRTLREADLALVRSLSPADLKRVGVHSERGEESLSHMIRLYAGHDLVHVRQIERIRSVVAPSRRAR
jgi:uncharacterized damage-inducible protein DinB